MSTLIDTHCHLDAEGFRNDLSDILQAAADSGLERIITIGTNLASSEAAIALASQHLAVSPVIGIHPNYVQNALASDWERIVELAVLPEVVGLGETGLDQYWDVAPLDLQIDYFQRHLLLSRACRKPFVVHCREAEQHVMEQLRIDYRNGPLNGVMHSFCGTVEMANECVTMGMFISFAGMLTFRKNDQLRAVAKTIPLDRLLVETDAPYLAPHPNRGKRNQPAWVRFTAECLAQIHDVTPEELAARTTLNAKRLFRLP